MFKMIGVRIIWKELVGEFGVPRNGKKTKGTAFKTFLNFLQMGTNVF